MAKVKTARKSTWIDMTAMVDVCFLLLTFFMLATKFKPDEAVSVVTPSSVSELKLPESKVMQIVVDKAGRIFFGLDGHDFRVSLLNRIAAKKGLDFTESEKNTFRLVETFGLPFSELKDYLAASNEQRSLLDNTSTGIPIDTAVTAQNELSDWLIEARRATGNQAAITIKGDKDANIQVIKMVVKTLQAQQVNRFSFVTSLEKED